MRYLGLGEEDRRAMLAEIGVGSVDELYRDVPPHLLHDGLPDLAPYQSEMAVEAAITRFAEKNRPASGGACFLGGGAYRHHVPASVDYLIQRGEFLTAYTPYQPEISQGTLQYLFEFQTQVAMITGMDIANASHYDGATACAEAALMARRITKRPKIVMSGGLHPHYRDTVRTYLQYLDAECAALPPNSEGGEDLMEMLDENTACVIVQNPDVFGRLTDLSPIAEACHDVGALLVVAVTEPVSLGLVRSPGDMGADIVAAEGQALGNGLNFGGPYLGLLATRDKYIRQIPGRLAGQAYDVDGRRGWVLTLAAREQHIRREKATSNICTNSGLCALAFTIHLALLGDTGFRKLAELNHAMASALAARLEKITGIEILNEFFFNEFTLRLPVAAAPLVEALAEQNLFAGVPLSRLYPDRDDVANLLLVAVTETVSEDDMDALCDALGQTS
jgi:glycine dehydrogenase subunit 1